MSTQCKAFSVQYCAHEEHFKAFLKKGCVFLVAVNETRHGPLMMDSTYCQTDVFPPISRVSVHRIGPEQ